MSQMNRKSGRRRRWPLLIGGITAFFVLFCAGGLLGSRLRSSASEAAEPAVVAYLPAVLFWPVPPTQLPPPTATNTPPPTAGNVQITGVHFDGDVPYVESDEYATISNLDGTAVNLDGWHLNADDPGQDFWFPSFDLQPGQSCRVYTNELHPESCGFSFGSGVAIWNNQGDCGHLYDAAGVEISNWCY